MVREKINQSGPAYLLTGARLALQPGLRRFILLPLLVNFLLFGSVFFWLSKALDSLAEKWVSWLPEWLHWLGVLIWPLIIFCLLLITYFLFTLIANWIAAPFNGLLAEQVEARLTGQPAPEVSWLAVLRDVPRVLAREWHKLRYYLPKALGCLLLLLIPMIGQTFGPLIWLLLCAWMAAVQYCDYSYDNHKTSFNLMCQDLRQRRWRTLGFGLVVSCATAIPLLNLFIMPVAVCGATALAVDLRRELQVNA